MGRKQDQAMSKFGVRKQVDQGQVRKKQQDKPKDIETMRKGPLKSKAGFTLYSHCSDTVKQTKPSVHKSLASSQKQTQDENEAEDQFLQQPDVVSQMQIQKQQTRSGETSSIVIPTGDMESSGDSTLYGHLDYLEFGTPFNKRLVSSTPDPESLLEADLMEHHMNQPSLMCPQVIPERDTSNPSKPTDLLATVASNLSEKLKVQRQQFQQNQQLLQQKQGQQSHKQWQQQSQQLKKPVSLNVHDENIVSLKLIHQPVVHSSDLPKMVPTPVLGANSIGAHGQLKKHPATSVDYSLNSQQDHAMGPTSSNLHHSSSAVMPKKSVHLDTADDIVSIRTKVTQNGSPVSKVTIHSQQDHAVRHTSSHLHHSSAVGMTKQSVHSDTADDIVSVKTKVSQNGSPVSKVAIVFSPENTQSNTIPSLSQPDLANDNINNYQFVKIASPKYKISSKKSAGNSSSSMKHFETATEVPTSAFSKPETYTGTQNSVMSSYLESSTVKKIPFPKLGQSSDENKLPDSQVSELPMHEEVAQHFVTDNPGETNNLKSYLVMKTTDNYSTKMAGDQSRGVNPLTVTSKTTAVKEINTTHQIGLQNNVQCSLGKETKSNVMFLEQPGNLNTVCITSPLKSQQHNINIGEDLRSQLNRNVLNEDSLDTSTDTCDLEVNSVLKQFKNNKDVNSEEGNSGVKGKVDGKKEDDGRMSVASVTSNLSQVIQFLKTDAFNQARESECGGLSIADNKNTEIQNTDTKNTDIKNTDTTAAYNPATDSNPDKQPGDNNALAELMRQYLPETFQNNESNNIIQHFDTCFNSNAKSQDQDGSFCDKDSKSKDPPAANFAEGEVDLNINQNHFRDEDSDEEVLIKRRWKHLQYLERMADPALRDVTRRLALKATALRDVELRELIDEMILITDACLGQEDARFQSAQMFFAEENNKLKKRIQTINQQLDAKERQERMGTFGHSNNDVLHLERKMMYLRDEKEKLDNQVTTLLEEKAKWLITQQDLVRTLSLKDHELLKLEEKHHEEKKSLLHSLEQATQNSQGVHYKLSVADKEISNLEQCIKSRNMEIANLKDLLKGMEGRLKESERHSKFKSQEILHLHDLVDALKIGVGHVLQAYETSSNKETTTVEQRQGMENLRQMVHPEEYRNKLTGPCVPTQTEQRKIQTQGPHNHRQTSSQTSSLPKESKTKNQFVREEYYPSSARDQLYQRHHSLEDSSYTTDHHMRYKSQDDEQDLLPLQLTSETLQEHNKRFSPVNKLLWRSLDNEPGRLPFGDQDPYYSDSEIEINGRNRRRSSFHRHGTTVGNLHRQSKPCSRLPHGQSKAKTEWHPRVYDNNWDMRRRNLNTTLESETVLKSRDNFGHNLTDPLSEDTYYSTLRSESIPERPYICERKPGSINLVQDSYQSVSLPATYQRHRERYNINRRNGQQHSFRHECEQIPGRALPENSWDLNDEDGHFVTLQSAHLPHGGHGSFQHDVETLPKTVHGHGSYQHDVETLPKSVHEGAGGSHSVYVQEDPSATIAQTDRTMLPRSNQPVECGGSTLYMPQPHSHHTCSGRQAEASQINDSLENPSFSRHSAPPCNDLHSIANESDSFSDISLSRRATKNSDSLTQREYFQGTELSASLSTISEVDAPSSNNNQLKALNEDPFSSGIATLDEKIADLQRKINRTKALYS